MTHCILHNTGIQLYSCNQQRYTIALYWDCQAHDKYKDVIVNVLKAKRMHFWPGIIRTCTYFNECVVLDHHPEQNMAVANDDDIFSWIYKRIYMNGFNEFIKGHYDPKSVVYKLPQEMIVYIIDIAKKECGLYFKKQHGK